MKFNISRAAIIIVVFACFVIDLDLKSWKDKDRVIEHDVHWYYGYLPAVFIYDDVELKKSSYNYEGNHYWFWPTITADGKKVIKTTAGLAILYFPFFFVAHAVAPLLGYPANGFSEPYKVFLLLSTIFYLAIGLGFLRKILLHYKFSDFHTAITILLLGLGTNLLCYSSQSAPMPHVYNFFLFSVFIYYTIKWYEIQSTKNTIILGLLLGLISLIRPSNAIILIFFIFYDISNLNEFKQRLLFFKKDCFLLNVILFFAFLVWIPQLLYWKKVTGSYLFYSYTEEGFFFTNPKIIQGLFSFRKGWLVYTPMMAFALLGIFLMKDSLKKLRISILLFFVLNIYVVFSWWCWWYGGTFGQRSLIESYALLAIPFASFVKYISASKKYITILFYCLSLFFVWLNIFQTYQFEVQTLHYEGMTKDLYFKQFGKLQKIPGFDTYIDWPDYEEAKTGKKAIETNENNKTVTNNYSGQEEISRVRINLKAANGKYLCADQTLENKIIANRDTAYDWETFSLVLFDNKECGLLSHNNFFFCTELDKRAQLTASRTGMGKWETFTLIKLDSNVVVFKATNNKYLTFDENSLCIFATSDTISDEEKFLLTKK